MKNRNLGMEEKIKTFHWMEEKIVNHEVEQIIQWKRPLKKKIMFKKKKKNPQIVKSHLSFPLTIMTKFQIAVEEINTSNEKENVVLKEVKFQIIIRIMLSRNRCSSRGKFYSRRSHSRCRKLVEVDRPRNVRWSRAPYQRPVHAFEKRVLLDFRRPSFLRQSILRLFYQKAPDQIPCSEANHGWFGKTQGLAHDIEKRSSIPRPFKRSLTEQ